MWFRRVWDNYYTLRQGSVAEDEVSRDGRSSAIVVISHVALKLSRNKNELKETSTSVNKEAGPVASSTQHSNHIHAQRVLT